MQAMKFKVTSPEQSKRLQEVLFKLGYSWAGEKVVKRSNAPYLYTDPDEDILWSNHAAYFDTNHRTEQDTEQFIAEHSKENNMMPHVHKDLIIAWANGATIEYYDNRNWFVIPNPRWASYTKYRIKPESVEMWRWCFGFKDESVYLTEDHYATEETAINEESRIYKPVWAVKLEPTEKLVEQ